MVSPTTEQCYSNTWELDWMSSFSGFLQHGRAAQQIISQQGSNSPLCNSSPRASTVVSEKKLQKGTSAWVDSSVNVYPGYGWAWTCEHDELFCWVFFHKCVDTKYGSSWMREQRDKGTSTTSWSAFVDQKKKKKSTMKWTNIRPSCYWDFWSYDKLLQS